MKPIKVSEIQKDLKLLICRYKGCSQRVLSPNTTVYSPTIEDIK